MTKEEAVIILCEHFSEGFVRTIVKAIAKDERDECLKLVSDGTGEPVQKKTFEILMNDRKRICKAICTRGQE